MNAQVLFRGLIERFAKHPNRLWRGKTVARELRRAERDARWPTSRKH